MPGDPPGRTNIPPATVAMSAEWNEGGESEKVSIDFFCLQALRALLEGFFSLLNAS